MTRVARWLSPAIALLAAGIAGGAAAGGLAGCGQRDDTIADRVEATPELSLLARALDAAGELDTLRRDGSMTLFAPTNQAITEFMATQGMGEAGLLTMPELAAVMRYHVAEPARAVADLEGMAELTTLDGRTLVLGRDPDGLLINDDARLEGEPLPASNGVIHLTDEFLARPTTTGFTSTPEVPLGARVYTADSIWVDRPGTVRAVEVDLDIAHDRVFSVIAWLRHEETGTLIELVGHPQTYNHDIQVTLTDRALLDVIDDLPFGDGTGPAFPAPRYRPVDPFRYLYGEAAAGTWTLYVYDGSAAQAGAVRVLHGWNLRLITTAEVPEPTLAMAPLRGITGVTAHGFRENMPVYVRRLAGLTGPITVTVTGDGFETAPVQLVANQVEADVPYAAAAGAVDGPRTVAVRAASALRHRGRGLDGAIVTADASGVELLAQIPLAELGAPGGSGNDVWGWTDPLSGREYALVGTSAGTAFVDVTAPAAPVYLGMMPTQTDPSLWRDIKVYADHAFVVSEANGHGLQVFDLTRLRGVTGPRQFAPDAHHGGFGRAHNLAIDEATGFAYVVGATETGLADGCATGGLLMIDVRTPEQPSFVGCFAGSVPAGAQPGPEYPSDVYTHDAECVVYGGPDLAHQGHEVCFTSDGQIDSASNDYLGIADVTDKNAPVQLARVGYAGSSYAHQGWLTEDQQYFLFNDEGDEFAGIGTRTYVFDVRDLDAPVLLGTFDNPRDAVGHNIYVTGGFAYQANYTSGLRIVDVRGVATMSLAEVGYYDTHPEDDQFDQLARCRLPDPARVTGLGPAAPLAGVQVTPHPGDGSSCGLAEYAGAWSNYPFFASGTIVVSDMERGLFVLRRTP